MDAVADDAATGAAGGNSRNPFASLLAGLPSSSSAAAASSGAPASAPASTVPNTSPLPNPWAPAGSQPVAGAASVVQFPAIRFCCRAIYVSSKGISSGSRYCDRVKTEDLWLPLNIVFGHKH